MQVFVFCQTFCKNIQYTINTSNDRHNNCPPTQRVAEYIEMPGILRSSKHSLAYNSCQIWMKSIHMVNMSNDLTRSKINAHQLFSLQLCPLNVKVWRSIALWACLSVQSCHNYIWSLCTRLILAMSRTS